MFKRKTNPLSAIAAEHPINRSITKSPPASIATHSYPCAMNEERLRDRAPCNTSKVWYRAEIADSLSRDPMR